MKKNTLFLISILVAGVFLFNSSALFAQNDLPYYLKDRGTGIATSMFGTYINKGEFIFYPFCEYYYDKDAEYEPKEFGYGLEKECRGCYLAHEYLIFLGYGISEKLAVEFESAVITATQYKAKDDPSNMPDKIEESGLGDVEGQLRWRLREETINRPELFSYFETVFPLQKHKKLIGTQDWEFKLGIGRTKGFEWGAMTLRAAIEYDGGENKVELGEFAIEYLKRVSKLFRYYVGVEGTQDEVELITELQFHISPQACIKVNNAFGITSKATDYAPEVGILFHF